MKVSGSGCGKKRSLREQNQPHVLVQIRLSRQVYDRADQLLQAYQGVHPQEQDAIHGRSRASTQGSVHKHLHVVGRVRDAAVRPAQVQVVVRERESRMAQ